MCISYSSGKYFILMSFACTLQFSVCAREVFTTLACLLLKQIWALSNRNRHSQKFNAWYTYLNESQQVKQKYVNHLRIVSQNNLFSVKCRTGDLKPNFCPGFAQGPDLNPTWSPEIDLVCEFNTSYCPEDIPWAVGSDCTLSGNKVQILALVNSTDRRHTVPFRILYVYLSHAPRGIGQIFISLNIPAYFPSSHLINLLLQQNIDWL